MIAAVNEAGEGWALALTRLDKLLADSGAFSRSEARDCIRAGRVAVDGTVVRQPEMKFDPAAAVMVDGKALNCAETRYLMLHKPAGVLSATEDPRQETVLDLLPKDYQRMGLFPVGRLDKDTTGLLLLTNDGDFAHRVITPKKHVPKVYRAEVDGNLDAFDAAAFAEGLTLADGTVCLPAKLEIQAPDVGRVTVFEGKYHQVKRMFAARGKPVLTLHREQIGALKLDSALAPGEFRELTGAELEAVFQTD